MYTVKGVFVRFQRGAGTPLKTAENRKTICIAFWPRIWLLSARVLKFLVRIKCTATGQIHSVGETVHGGALAQATAVAYGVDQSLE
jgi:hypothetical protein